MLLYNDSYSCFDENDVMKLSIFSTVGNREQQQDRAGYELKSDCGIVAICDGMGGHEGGQIASTIAVNMLLDCFLASYPCEQISNMLENAAIRMDEKVSGLTHEDGTRMRSGSTLAAVVVEGRHLYWVSVGDSHIYLMRKGEFVQVSRDHIYQNRLDQMLEAGQISEEKYWSESEERGDALISFLGVGGLEEIDRNEIPFELEPDDRILLTTDGLYKVISEDDIGKILENFSNPNDALGALEKKVAREAQKRKISRDNMTMALIKI